MDSLIALLIAISLTATFLKIYLTRLRRRELMAKEAAEKGQIFSEGPRGQHPQIDNSVCIGCGGCTSVCPEGDVLTMLGGKAVIVNPHRCIGHSLCADACPVGAIKMMMAHPSVAANMPYLTSEFETNVGDLFIIGELGGLALIKNAVNQGRECIDTITKRIRNQRTSTAEDVYEVLIVGAGPAGISASLRAIENKLRYITLEQDEVGGTIAKFPRQKIVMTSPVELPLYGKLDQTELSKEHLLALWDMILNRADFNVSTGERVQDMKKRDDGIFVVSTGTREYFSRYVVLAMGRSGTPRKLGCPGEELPKVMYRLLETDHYRNKKILVVGGGDSAVEAALGLAFQQGNQVTLSYRRDHFVHIKARNDQRIKEAIAKRKITVLFNSNVVEFTNDTVILDVQGRRHELANDYVWIFAGGLPPTELLTKAGVEFSLHNVTAEASREARKALHSTKSLQRIG